MKKIQKTEFIHDTNKDVYLFKNENGNFVINSSQYTTTSLAELKDLILDILSEEDPNLATLKEIKPPVALPKIQQVNKPPLWVG